MLLALAAALVVAAGAGCGGGPVALQRAALPGATLPGWTVVDDPPGISQLAPDL